MYRERRKQYNEPLAITLTCYKKDKSNSKVTSQGPDKAVFRGLKKLFASGEILKLDISFNCEIKFY